MRTNLTPTERLQQLERRRDGHLIEADRTEQAAANRRADLEAAGRDPEADHRYQGFVASARQNRADGLALDEQVIQLRSGMGDPQTRAPRRRATPAARQSAKTTRRPAGETL